MDFIPLNANKPVVYGVEKQGKNKRKGEENMAGGADRDRRSLPGPASKKKMRLVDHKLGPRIRDYLERNHEKEYIDVEDMAHTLHTNHPEYQRKKLRDFARVRETRNGDAPSSPAQRPTPKESKNNPTETGKSMGNSMSKLYASPGPSDSASAFDRAMARADQQNDSCKKKPSPSKASKSREGKESPASAPPKASQEANSASDIARSAPSPEVVFLPQNGELLETVMEEEAGDRLPAGRIASESKRSSRAASPAVASLAGKGAAPAARKPVASKRRAAAAGTVIHPRTKFSDLGGCEEAVESLFQATRHLLRPQGYLRLGVAPPRGCVLHGPPGCGKTMLAHAAAGTLGLPMLTVAGTELISGVSGDSEEKIRDLFEQAKSMTPCLVFIDGLDVVAKRRENAQKDMEVRIVSQLLSCLDDLNALPPEDEAGRVFVLGATDRMETIEPALRAGHRLEWEVAMGIPDAQARKKMLEVMCKDCNIEEAAKDYQRWARLTPGYVGSDLKALITQASRFAMGREDQALRESFSQARGGAAPPDSPFPYEDYATHLRGVPDHSVDPVSITAADFESALKVVQPSAMKEGFATVPNISFDDIGALDDIRRELEMAVCVPVLYPDTIRRLGLDVPSGVLLCGPPGCGKTLLAKAVANQAGINFISVKGPEMINMYVGESERAIRQVFQRARNSSPCVIFFDEIDSICPRRSGHDGGSGSNRIVNQLLTEMDGGHGRKGVYVMGATNRVDMIDEAILRPGRLTNVFFVDLPSAQGRADILRKLTKGGTRPRLAGDVDLNAVAHLAACEGFSGADLGNLVTRAAQIRLEELCGRLGAKPGVEELGEDEDLVGMAHLEQALKWVTPSVSGKQKHRYDAMRRKYSKGRPAGEDSGQSGDGEGEPRQPTSTPASPPGSPRPASSPATSRFLPGMCVRIGDGAADASCRGREARVARVAVHAETGRQHCVVSLGPEEGGDDGGGPEKEVDLPTADLEPFTPGPGEKAKLLQPGEDEAVGLVLGLSADGEEEFEVRFGNGVRKIPIDLLCRVTDG